MHDSKDVQTMLLDLKVDSKNLLFILVAGDEAINRIGNGTLGNKNFDMLIGCTGAAIFERVRSHLVDSVLQDLGKSIQCGTVKGLSCKFTVIVGFTDGTEDSFEYLYGSESQGPPKYVVDFVRVAIAETEGWYQEQIRMVTGSQDGSSG